MKLRDGRRVYIAGPYTKPSPILNVRKAVEVADQLLSLGYVPFVPHLSHFWEYLSPKPYELWLEYDLEWLKACDAMVVLPGESPGAQLERTWAGRFGIPVFESVEELVTSDAINNIE